MKIVFFSIATYLGNFLLRVGVLFVSFQDYCIVGYFPVVPVFQYPIIISRPSVDSTEE